MQQEDDVLPRATELPFLSVLGLNFAGCVSLASQSPYTIIVYSAPIIDPILVTFGQICNFRNPNFVTFYF